MNLGGVGSNFGNSSFHGNTSNYGSLSGGSDDRSNVAFSIHSSEYGKIEGITLKASTATVAETKAIGGLPDSIHTLASSSLKQHYREVRAIRKGGRRPLKSTSSTTELDDLKDVGSMKKDEDLQPLSKDAKSRMLQDHQMHVSQNPKQQRQKQDPSKVFELEQEQQRVRTQRSVPDLKRNNSDLGDRRRSGHDVTSLSPDSLKSYQKVNENEGINYKDQIQGTLEQSGNYNGSGTTAIATNVSLPMRSKSSHGSIDIRLNNNNIPTSEVDFYRNPTILSRLVLNEKYKASLRRLQDHPKEAAVWVCAKRMVSTTLASTLYQRQQQSVYSIRQLPIHIACRNLRRTSDSKRKRLLNDLIANLIFSNPGGSNEMDHHGRYPIHDAIWHGATAETISLFLMATPTSVHLKDYKNRSLMDVNRHSPRTERSKNEIQKVLELDEEFWKKARQEAAFRLKSKAVKWPIDTASVGSLSVLASSSKADDEGSTLGTVREKMQDNQRTTPTSPLSAVDDINNGGSDEDDDNGSSSGDSYDENSDQAQADSKSGIASEVIKEAKFPQKKTNNPNHAPEFEHMQQRDVMSNPTDTITPISWEQLEVRAITSEQILMEMNEQYYEMSKTVEALTVLGEQKHKELISELTRLSRENNSLNNKLRRLQSILEKIANMGEDAVAAEIRKVCLSLVDTAMSLADASSTDSSFDSFDIEANENKIREKIASMSQNQIQQQEHIRKLSYFLGTVVLQDKGGSGGVTSSLKSQSTHSIQNTVLSALTEGSAKSKWIKFEDMEQRRLVEKIVDTIPTHSMMAQQYGGDDDINNNNNNEDGDQVEDNVYDDENENDKLMELMDEEDETKVDIVDDLSDVFRFVASASTTEVHLSPLGIMIKRKATVKNPSSSPLQIQTLDEPIDNMHHEEAKMSSNDEEDDDDLPSVMLRKTTTAVGDTTSRKNDNDVSATKKPYHEVKQHPVQSSNITSNDGITTVGKDVDVPALFAEDYEFETWSKISDFEKRIFG